MSVPTSARSSGHRASRQRWHAGFALAALFVMAAGVRVYDIQDTFVGLLPVREFRSAIVAREMFLSARPDVPAWQREVARVSRQREVPLEPPVLETLAAWGYRLSGGERLWLPRLLSVLFYLGSSVLFWRLAVRLFPPATAVVLTAYCLFVPIGVIASKSFQPDALMMLLYVASLLAMVRYDETPTTGWLLAFVAAAGVAVLVRPICVFPIVGAFGGLTVRRVRRDGMQLVVPMALFGAALAFAVSYYAHALFAAETLGQQADLSFRPHLWTTRVFWRDWFFAGIRALTTVGLVGALLGLLLVESRRLRWLLLGLWTSHVAFGLVFSYHISTHDYYHLQMVPTVALTAGPLVTLLLARLRQLDCPRLRLAAAAVAMAGLIAVAGWRVARHGRDAHDFEDPALAATIGEIVEHSTEVVYLSRYYGRPLEYFGQLSGAYWPRATTAGIYDPNGAKDVTVDQRLDALDFVPKYFVITDFREMTLHHDDLGAYLAGHCELLSGDVRYRVYDRCQ